jgi:hypothetical protein
MARMLKASTIGPYGLSDRGYAPYPPPTAGPDQRIAGLVVLTFIIIIIVVMAALGWYFISSLDAALKGLNGGDCFGSRIGFGQVTARDYMVNGTRLWNVSANVTLVHYGGGVSWSSLRGRLYLETTYPPPRYTEVYLTDVPIVPKPVNATAGPFIYYEERAGLPDMMEPGDVVGVSGVSRSLQGCVLKLNDTNSELTWRTSFTVPVLAPAMELGLGACNVTTPHRGVYEWDAVVPVLNVTPATERLAWSDLRTNVQGYVNGSILTLAPTLVRQGSTVRLCRSSTTRWNPRMVWWNQGTASS